MGADLYINSIADRAYDEWKPTYEHAIAARDAAKTEEARQRYQKKVDEYFDKMYPDEGYFRDSYNGTNVLWTCGLSWWQDVIPLCDEDGMLSPEKAKQLIEMIEANDHSLPTEEQLRGANCKVDEYETVESWHVYFIEKRERLLAFLARAIEMNEPIYCSL